MKKIIDNISYLFLNNIIGFSFKKKGKPDFKFDINEKKKN